MTKSLKRRVFVCSSTFNSHSKTECRGFDPFCPCQNSKYRFCGACCFLYVQKKTAQGTRRVPGVIDERCLRQIQRGDNGAAVGGKTTLPGSFSPDTARMVVKRPLFLFIIKISSERESVLWAVWDFYPNLFLKPF